MSHGITFRKRPVSRHVITINQTSSQTARTFSGHRNRGTGVRGQDSIWRGVRNTRSYRSISWNHVGDFPRILPLAVWEADDMFNTVLERLCIPYNPCNDCASISVYLVSNDWKIVVTNWNNASVSWATWMEPTLSCPISFEVRFNIPSTQVFQDISFIQVSLRKFCMHLSFRRA